MYNDIIADFIGETSEEPARDVSYMSTMALCLTQAGLQRLHDNLGGMDSQERTTVTGFFEEACRVYSASGQEALYYWPGFSWDDNAMVALSFIDGLICDLEENGEDNNYLFARVDEDGKTFCEGRYARNPFDLVVVNGKIDYVVKMAA